MSNEPNVALVYDGDCPICSAYCRAVALRALDADFRLINAREDHPIVKDIERLGLDMDEGFVLYLHGKYYHGAEAIHRLSLLTTRAGLLNRLNFLVFRSPRLSRIIYPTLRSGRNLVLFLLGRRMINR